MAACLKRFHETELLFGRDAGEDGGALGHFGKFVVGNLFQFSTGQGDELAVFLAALQSDLSGDGARGDEVVARDHLHRDAGALALTHGRNGGGARRIHHRLQAEEGETGGDVGMFELGVMRLYLTAGQRQHAESTHAHRFGGAMHGVPVERDECVVLAERVGAAFEQAFERADFVDDAAFVRLVQGGAEHVLGLEGNRIQHRGLTVRVGVNHSALFSGNEQRSFGGITLHLEPSVFAHELRLVAEHAGEQTFGERAMLGHLDDVAIETKLALGFVAPTGHLVEFSACKNFLHRHLVLGERAGFVRANHRGAAERFDGGQLADDGLPLRHPRHADGEHDGDGGGQSFRNRADRQRHRRHEHLDRLFATRNAERERGRCQADDDPEHQLAELRDLLRQRRGQFDRAGNEMGDASRLGLIADGPHDALGLAAGDERAGVGEVFSLGENRVQRERVGVLGYGKRLASQR